MASTHGAPAMTSLRPSVPVSIPALAAGGANGINDVTAAQENSDEIDRLPEARLGNVSTAGTDAPPPTPNGQGEQKAALASSPKPTDPASAQLSPEAAAAANANLPTNHPPTKEQIKLYNKQVKRVQEAQKKAAAKAAASGQPAATKPAPADSTTPAAATPAPKAQ